MKKLFCVFICVLFILPFVTISGSADIPRLSKEHYYSKVDCIDISNPFSSQAFINKVELHVLDIFYLFINTHSDFGYTLDDIENLEISGPFPIINIDENAIGSLDYYFVNNGVVLGIVHIYLSNNKIHAEFGVDYANQINKYLSADIPFCIIHSNAGIYIASDSNVETIINMFSLPHSALSDIDNFYIKENSDIARINEYYEAGLFFDKLVSKSTFNVTYVQVESFFHDHLISSSNSIQTAPPTPPLVPQYEPSEKWCHNAVTASVVAAREPDLYGELTAGDVYSEYNQGLISYEYGRARKTCDLIKNYLTSPDHYTTYVTTAVTLSQFKNNIDNGHYVAAISLLQNYGTSYHVTLLYDYFVGLSGSTTVRMMDPYNQNIDPISYRYCTWSGSTFTFSMYGNSSYTYEMSENVISWY